MCSASVCALSGWKLSILIDSEDVIGDGPQFAQAKALAGPNVKLLGYQPHDVLHSYLQNAKAFIFAAEEDYGIAPIEAQACGTPVLAYGKGGASETVADGVTGYHFNEQTVESLCATIERFESTSQNFSSSAIRTHALRFSESRFKREFKEFVESKYEMHQRMLSCSSTASIIQRLVEAT